MFCNSDTVQVPAVIVYTVAVVVLAVVALPFAVVLLRNCIETAVTYCVLLILYLTLAETEDIVAPFGISDSGVLSNSKYTVLVLVELRFEDNCSLADEVLSAFVYAFVTAELAFVVVVKL